MYDTKKEWVYKLFQELNQSGNFFLHLLKETFSHNYIYFFNVQNTFIFNVNTKELKGKITNRWKSIY